MMPIDISFIICTYNGAKRLPKTVDCLIRQNGMASGSWEVVIVDNASTDGTGDVARELAASAAIPIRVIEEPRCGRVHAFRTGLDAARGRLFTAVDDDNHLSDRWALTSVRFFSNHPKAGLAGGRIHAAFEDDCIAPLDFEAEYAPLLAVRDYGDAPTVGIRPIGAGMTGRTELMRRVYELIPSYTTDRTGESLVSGEDVERSMTIGALGWELWYLPDLDMEHVLPARRLRRDYIEELSFANIRNSAWFSVFQRQTKLSRIGLVCRVIVDGGRVTKYAVLAQLPTSWDPRLKKARFWRRFYFSRACGTLELARRASEAGRIQACIESCISQLGPGGPPVAE